MDCWLYLKWPLKIIDVLVSIANRIGFEGMNSTWTFDFFVVSDREKFFKLINFYFCNLFFQILNLDSRQRKQSESRLPENTVWISMTEFHKIILNFHRLSRFLWIFLDFYWLFMDFLNFSWVLMDFYRIFMNFLKLSWIFLRNFMVF